MSLVDRVLRDGMVPSEELNASLAESPWFSVARALKEQSEGHILRHEIDAEKIAEESEGEIISRFLRKGDYRIVAEEGDVYAHTRGGKEYHQRGCNGCQGLASISK